jgi:hypothetical protein
MTITGSDDAGPLAPAPAFHRFCLLAASRCRFRFLIDRRQRMGESVLLSRRSAGKDEPPRFGDQLLPYRTVARE